MESEGINQLAEHIKDLRSRCRGLWGYL